MWRVLLALAFATVGPALAAAQARVPTIGVLILARVNEIIQ